MQSDGILWSIGQYGKVKLRKKRFIVSPTSKIKMAIMEKCHYNSKYLCLSHKGIALDGKGGEAKCMLWKLVESVGIMIV